jgi:hypothetical protein
LHHDALPLRVGVQEGGLGQGLFRGVLATHGLVERSEGRRGGVEWVRF